MGKLVTFWSPYSGHGKVTSTLCAIAGGFGLRYPELNVAISHIRMDSLKLEEKLTGRTILETKKEFYETVGMSALRLNCRRAVLSEDIIRRCGIMLRMKSLWLYPNAGREEMNQDLTFCLLTEQLKKEFDVVFLDLESSSREDSLAYMEAADYTVVVLPQEPSYVEAFFKEAEAFGKLRYGIVFGGYLTNSKYSRRYYGKRSDRRSWEKIIGTIPWNEGFFDAMCDGKTLDFFLRNQMARKKEENYEFIFQTGKTAEQIKERVLPS